MPLRGRSLSYTFSEDEFYPKSSNGEGSTSVCNCTSPSTTITSINGNVAPSKQNFNNVSMHFQHSAFPRKTEPLHIEDIELRFDSATITFCHCINIKEYADALNSYANIYQLI